MPPLNSRIWRRYGQLRIYVSAGDQPVGWCDPRTGRFQISQANRRDEFWAAIRAECGRLTLAGQIAGPVLPPEASAPTHQRLPADRPGTQPADRPGTQPADRPGTQPADRPGTQPADRPGTQPADRPGTQPAAPSPASRPSPHGQDPHGQDPHGDDLARNPPGAAASARARELRREHPLLTGAAALFGIRTPAQSFAAGARGERTIGRQLSRWAARYGWHVLHAVPVGRRGADIDHVIIGPFGVVTVNTKTTGTAVWVGEYGLTVGGKPVDYLGKSRNEAARARSLLSQATGLDVPVQSAIVFAGARRVTVRRGGPADVAVLPSPRALCHWLRTQAPRLQPGQMQTIYEAARRPANWQSR